MKHTDIKEILDKQHMGETLTVCGWVRTSRDSKNMAFLELNDGTSLDRLQIVINKEVITDVAPFMKLGSALKVEGKVVPGRLSLAEKETYARVPAHPSSFETAHQHL